MDDGSSDGTVELVNRIGDSRIRVFSDGVHRGLSAQLNRAVQMSSGKYFARMDADDIAYPERLDRQVKYLESHSNTDLLSTSVLVFRSDGRALGIRQVAASHLEICSRPWLAISMPHPTWMGKIEWFRANPYSCNAKLMEDYELLIRTYKSSCFASLPEPLLAYREDRLSFSRILIARKNVCKVLVQRALRGDDPGVAFAGIATQISKAVFDAVAIGTGLGYRLLRHRAGRITEEASASWGRLWAHVCRAADQLN